MGTNGREDVASPGTHDSIRHQDQEACYPRDPGPAAEMWGVASDPSETVFWMRGLAKSNGTFFLSRQVALFCDLDLGLVGLVGSFSACRATSEPNSFIQLFFKEIFGGGRGDSYTFSYMISPVSMRIAFGIQ